MAIVVVPYLNFRANTSDDWFVVVETNSLALTALFVPRVLAGIATESKLVSVVVFATVTSVVVIFTFLEPAAVANAVLAASVLLVHVASVITVTFPVAHRLATLSAVAAVAVSSFVTYLLLVLGVPLVPARASYLGLSWIRATGIPAGATSVLTRPALASVAFHGLVPVSILCHAESERL